jgi:hypothetical protein
MQAPTGLSRAEGAAPAVSDRTQPVRAKGVPLARPA